MWIVLLGPLMRLMRLVQVLVRILVLVWWVQQG